MMMGKSAYETKQDFFIFNTLRKGMESVDAQEFGLQSLMDYGDWMKPTELHPLTDSLQEIP